jgi:hypothetical protein
MKVLRFQRRVGLVMLVAAIPVLVFDSAARPSGSSLIVAVAVAVPAGVLAGLAFRLYVPLERRLKFFRDLSPRLARRLVPDPADEGPDHSN